MKAFLLALHLSVNDDAYLCHLLTRYHQLTHFDVQEFLQVERKVTEWTPSVSVLIHQTSVL